MNNVKTRDVIAYTMLPRIIPRLKRFVTSGFGFMTLLVAHAYATVRLLPEGHPYLDTKNMGRFGIRHVVAEAGANLTFSRKNIDQILVFFAILAGIILLFLQFAVLLYSLTLGSAHAFSWFDTADPATDVAFTLMDRVFGLPNVFCSAITPANCTDYSADTDMDGAAGPIIPRPFHVALHELFRFYSQGLLLIGMMIFLYFIVVIVLETAVSGTPFGQRFQNVWVPVRLVAALGLLMPVNYGLNSGQWITLYIAKYGSSFATTGWRDYNSAISTHTIFSGVPVGTDEILGNPIGSPYNLIAIPPAPSMFPVISTMAIVHTCAYMYHRKALQPGGTGTNITNAATGALWPETGGNLATYGYVSNNILAAQRVAPFLVKEPTAAMIAANGNTLVPGVVADDANQRSLSLGPGGPYYGRSYLQALGFYYGGDIIIRFGEYAVDYPGAGAVPRYKNDLGYVKPLCGDIRIPTTTLQGVGDFATRGGAPYMQEFYYRTILDMWFARTQFQQFARMMVSKYTTTIASDHTALCSTAALSGMGSPGFPATAADCEGAAVTSEWKTVESVFYGGNAANAVRRAWELAVSAGYGKNMTNRILNLGWGGAGVWFHKVADINGNFIEGVMAIPKMDLLPAIMKEVADQKYKLSKSVNPGSMYSANFIVDDKTELPNLQENYSKEFSVVFDIVNKYFDKVLDLMDDKKSTTNAVENVMKMITGLGGLLAIRESNTHTHPLAQLAAVGKSLIVATVQNLAAATAFSAAGGLLAATQGEKSRGAAMANALSSALLSIAFTTLTVGVVLYYVLPFLPFVYFYFAVGGWVKAIFEAMVGVPLWALAHLRIDGDGLPGDAAQNGYFLLLEIFVRPILTLFGLIAAISIFAVQIYILNMTWDLVTINATGFKPGTDILTMSQAADLKFERGSIDKFFFTIIYTIICYMTGLASFKLIDNIPDNILRWAGAGVSSFGDIDKDHVEALNRYAAMGSMTMGSQASQAIVEGAGGIGRGVGLSLKGAVAKTPGP